MRYRRTTRGGILISEIAFAYKEAFGIHWWNLIFGSPFKLADQSYLKADEELIDQILEEDETDLMQYIAEDFDCDDFAFRLMGVFHQTVKTAAMPIFITWVGTPQGGHAVLSYYCNGEVWIIEPQNDAIFSVPKSWTLALLCG